MLVEWTNFERGIGLQGWNFPCKSFSVFLLVFNEIYQGACFLNGITVYVVFKKRET